MIVGFAVNKNTHRLRRRFNNLKAERILEFRCSRKKKQVDVCRELWLVERCWVSAEQQWDFSLVHHSTSSRCPAHLLFTRNLSSSAAFKANTVERQRCAGTERVVSPTHGFSPPLTRSLTGLYCQLRTIVLPDSDTPLWANESLAVTRLHSWKWTNSFALEVGGVYVCTDISR